ncbi:Trafficking protein particle complex subunit BET5 [Entomophthora muscae]|uniref:Trafficking protein particle complex subunit BET5 n=1 Tax=Entomophthora muscae TaxID=34485 RepID=A0ACC2RNW7_9FUNG|nr:Trafficking protein particle complex subunit BET5 [Entomophthora muscae]
MIYNFYLFDRHCECVYYLEFQNRANFTTSGGLKPGPSIDYFSWPETNNSKGLSSTGSSYFPPNFSEPNFIERNKLVYGVVFSLKTFAKKLAGPLEDGFLSFSTKHYKLHYLETLTGLRLVLTSDPLCPNLRPQLWTIFSTLYVENVVKNPTSSKDFSEFADIELDSSLASSKNMATSTGHDLCFNNDLFTQSVVKYLTQLPFFSS